MYVGQTGDRGADQLRQLDRRESSATFELCRPKGGQASPECGERARGRKLGRPRIRSRISRLAAADANTVYRLAI